MGQFSELFNLWIDEPPEIEPRYGIFADYSDKIVDFYVFVTYRLCLSCKLPWRG